ncbi:DUF2537 domain-containing protein [Rhodococcus sp. Z13]|uniref:DUF2537 domain-containing protein n=1 Tax=Rhodococcus sacchari TaxID=2962047 RepID=A0ACD4DI11_9NOCA|nr:DUF2537 domain-containing protein [Rhodococcus sp. Z13]UYP19704.1 DUF2537 domain-containing protein [Rhodococcus sp. Z13]
MRPASDSAPTPWATGLTLTAFSLAATVVAVVAFGQVLARIHPILAIAVNLVAAAGSVPTLWAWIRVPVLRWFAAGVAAGIPIGWLVLLVS